MLLIALRNQYVELYETLAIRWPQLAQAFGAGVMVFLLWINLDSGWMVLEKSAGLDPRDETGQLDYAMVAVRIVGAVLVVPLMEELFWRSFLMRWIDRKDFLNHAPADVSFKALFLTSCVFASAHAHWFAGLVAGIVYGWLYIRTRNLWMPVIAHAITNGILGVWVVHAGRWDFW